ncbi:hypothetical protein ACNNLQ_08275 [Aerococcus urinaeequi]
MEFIDNHWATTVAIMAIIKTWAVAEVTSPGTAAPTVARYGG